MLERFLEELWEKLLYQLYRMTSSQQLGRYKLAQDRNLDVSKMYKEEHTEAVLLVYAAITFNSVNRKVFLCNINVV